MLDLPGELTPPFEYTLAFIQPSGVDTVGDITRTYPLMSVTKLLSTLGVLVAAERSMIGLDDMVEIADGQRTVTLRHLLAHASGLAFDSQTLVAKTETKRVYSNTGFEQVAKAVEVATGTDFPTWVEQAVLEPLGLVETQVEGSAAYGAKGSLRDLVAVAKEFLNPSLISKDLAQEAYSVAYARLRGITPGYGSYADNTWGLGVEIKGDKTRTWFPSSASSTTFGHFGQSGSLLWVDPTTGRGMAFLGAEPFGPWHTQHWQRLGDHLLESVN